MRRCLLTALLTIAVLAAGTQAARADGDPGSDVLVYQPLFLTADAGVSVNEQVRLSELLQAASRSGFPIRVAIIARQTDLGAVTALWRKPRAYARFLGLELSLAYTGRLLVLMPNGFGFNWPGHPATTAYLSLSRISIATGGGGLADAVQAAVKSLAAADGVKLSLPARSSGAAHAPQPAPANTTSAPAVSSADEVVAFVAVALLAAAALALLARKLLRRRRPRGGRLRNRLRQPRPAVALPSAVAIVAGAGIVALASIGPPSTTQTDALASNPNLDPGTPLSRPAPGFTLTDQFGQPVSLRSFRGKVVLLAFNDSECTTICPLTTTAMLEAKAMLGPAGARLQLLGIDANPKATALEDVLSYSQLHGLLSSWHFLTGSLTQLKSVWKAYGVQAAIQGGQIAHTPALFVIDPRGRLARLYMTQQSYAAVPQLGQLLAREASRLLPNHPTVGSDLAYAHISGISPAATVTLPRAGGGGVRLGPGRSRLYLFFDTWDQEVTSLAGQLEALGRYHSSPASSRLPALTAVDEATVEPSSFALRRFLAALPRPLAYPVAIDSSGRVADGYGVQGEPWFVLSSPSGQILWSWQVSTSGWLSRSALIAHVRAALARAPKAPTSAAAVQRDLAGSPQPLAALHQQASWLLGPAAALVARVRALRGYPVVINAWASWCTPCQQEFGLFATASAHYGRQVAFLGADTADSASDARSFLAQHAVSYPSYQASTGDLDPLVPQGLAGLPTTIFLNRQGKLVYVHTGQYESQGALDADIESYELGG